jgi:hypothetical protein
LSITPIASGREGKKHATLWGNFETRANRFPGHLPIYANLKLFSGELNSDDLNEGLKNPYKMKLIEF